MKPHFRAAIVACVLGCGALAARGEVIITEIMYNPASSERLPVRTEWVEIYNTGDKPVDLTEWYLQDEDGRTMGLPKGTKLAPGKAAVLVPADVTVEQFREAWGDGFEVYRLENWGQGGMNGLANSPSPTNENLTLRDNKGLMRDEVKFDDEGDWPSDEPEGPSIYLKPGRMTAKGNDAGGSWARAEADKHGGRQNKTTQVFNNRDTGSPGVVIAAELGQG